MNLTGHVNDTHAVPDPAVTEEERPPRRSVFLGGHRREARAGAGTKAERIKLKQACDGSSDSSSKSLGDKGKGTMASAGRRE
ncbi:hypothetical protein EYF80_039488 [Liparis tanakae]|uniref:Uncharacterized protein n=1 Tax=Liparis tanakae TaxID=230148 RepID=A0A4Z2GCH1_9TELE|nr:hypothetical protein EYF80_039488 [Liparis tanakae]